MSTKTKKVRFSIYEGELERLQAAGGDINEHIEEAARSFLRKPATQHLLYCTGHLKRIEAELPAQLVDRINNLVVSDPWGLAVSAYVSRFPPHPKEARGSVCFGPSSGRR